MNLALFFLPTVIIALKYLISGVRNPATPECCAG